ncbi:M14 family zinc carboxypeptidase [Lutibacter sp.]|uniref:M14 family zinc carboxypeptidase n=1 Tax=Lutibacter sp. TaxID=1925666 RepID=UPI002734561D|nr:M14 family zinc carboxypeptidase [Lutibacter sp.]MDP3313511.1 M14 family zinc carboxypeptidase [Lutibacter sp.]
MKKCIVNLFFLVVIGTVHSFAQNIQSPSEFLGYELGTRFTRHHDVVAYFTYVSNNSKSVKLEKYGETNEFRPLYISYVSSEENISNLKNIREDNLKRTGILKGEVKTDIAIVWLSYNVHGNEASSTEAAMQTIYNLITEKQEWLKNTIVIIDPCINPDGRSRYVNWFNETKNTPYNTNPDVVEHNEPWPGGRANHYLFDLNRDWAWATQIETQQRLKVYNKWMPHIHVDFHEQFINNPYYFAPGAEPYHEIITTWQRNFQIEIGKNHAKYFDKNGWQYFTKESFDLFYPSYGDTYPTYMGAIGMTYEQAGHGRAGLGIIIENKTELTLKDRIKHHTTSGISTVEMASMNASKLVSEFQKFFNNSSLKYKSYVLRGDDHKLKKIKALLEKHEIESYSTEEKTIKAFNYQSNSIKSLKTNSRDLVISTNQPKGKMVKVLFEPEAKLSDSLTYDITAWSIPYAYGVEGFASETELLKGKQNDNNKTELKNEIVPNTYAYVSNWSDVSDAEFLGDLLEKDFNVRYSNANFTIEGTSFKKGTLIVMKGENEHIQNFDESITQIATSLNKNLISVKSGFSDTGFDFGSSNYSLIKNKKIAVLSGENVSSLSFGEIWHFFESQLQYPINVINVSSLKRIDLSKYNVVITPNEYVANKDDLAILSEYVTKGGTIVAIESSLKSFANKEGFALKIKKDTLDDKSKPKVNLIPYNQQERESLKNTITGSIFNGTIDTTHPLAYGYENNYNSLKLNSDAYQLLEKGINVGYFSDKTINISGFAGSNALKEVPNSLLFGIERKGKGQLIYMVDNPLFRSFWENGKLFFANAVFLN